MTETEFYEEKCKECPHYPSSTKQPAKMKMKSFRLNKRTMQLLEQTAKHYGVEPSCVLCKSIRLLTKTPIEIVIAALKGVTL
jgi:hypothetical protein